MNAFFLRRQHGFEKEKEKERKRRKEKRWGKRLLCTITSTFDLVGLISMHGVKPGSGYII